MAHYLVTGGAGFIGSHLVEELLRRGEKVRILDNFSTGKRENVDAFAGRIELIEGDIRSHHIVREAVEGVDFVLHQGALPSVPRSINDPITTNEVNVGGTLNILDAARDADPRSLRTPRPHVHYATARTPHHKHPETHIETQRNTH